MLIKGFSCNRFAGLKEVDIQFEKGLNVILGPNESGKSSIVEGIYATLFIFLTTFTRTRVVSANFITHYSLIVRSCHCCRFLHLSITAVMASISFCHS